MDYEELILSELKFADKVTRKRLQQLTGLSDWENRFTITEMRKKYIPISVHNKQGKKLKNA